MSRLDATSSQLLTSCRTDDSEAATELHKRYAARLVALVEDRMSARLSQRLDAEDIVQSAFRSFFLKARQGRFRLERSGDLWRLLAAISLNKLLKQVEQHGAARRSAANESPILADASSREPGPDDVATLADLLQSVKQDLDPAAAEAFDLRLAEYTIEEIAAKTGRSERTIRRWLAEVRTRLEALLHASEQ